MRKALAWTLVLALVFSAIGALADGIQFPSNLLQIADEAFMGNTAIESVTLNEGVKEIGARAFRNCSALKEITLPDSIEFIGEDAFDPDVTILCNLDTPAYEYAMSNDCTVSVLGTYTVRDARMEGNTLIATVTNTLPCGLRAELLDDDQTNVLYAETRNIPGGGTDSREFSFDIDPLPESYAIRVSLVDAAGRVIDYPFISLENTQAHRLFEQKTPEDFAGSTVLDFKDAGFGVLNDDVITVSGRASGNAYIVTTDAALAVGDAICIPECNAMVKIASLRRNDDGSYTVTADDNASVMDFYQFLRVSETVDAGDAMDDDDSSLMFAGDFSYGGTRDLKRFSKHLEYRASTVDLTAGVSVTYSIKRDSKTLGEDYLECELTATVDGGLNYTLSKGITLEHTFFLPKINLVTTVFGLTIPFRMSVPLELTAEASLGIETSFDLSGGIRYRTKSGVTPHRDGNFHAKYSTEGKITGSAGVHMEVGLNLIGALDASVGVGIGGEFTATTNPIDIDVENNEIEKMHSCMLCFDVAVDRYINLTADLTCKIPFTPKYEFKHTWPVLEERVYEGYLSLINPPFSLFEGKVSHGEGPCPNVKYKTKISVIDKDNNPVPDAQYKITGTTVIGSPAQTLIGTGSHAESLYPGSYTVEAEYEGLKGSRDFTVSDQAQSVTVKIRDDQDPGIPIDAAHFWDDYFREYVRQFDTDKDNYLSDDEIYEVRRIDVSGDLVLDENGYIKYDEEDDYYSMESMNRDLRSLWGIKYFYNLESLDCSVSTLVGLDVSGLTNLRFLSCNDVPCLEYLYARGCTELLWISDPRSINLKKIDVSGCTSLVGLECGGSWKPNTTIITELSSIVANGCTSLVSIYCAWNPKLSYLDLSGCENLKAILCAKCDLSSLDLRSIKSSTPEINIDYGIRLRLRDDQKPIINFLHFDNEDQFEEIKRHWQLVYD